MTRQALKKLLDQAQEIFVDSDRMVDFRTPEELDVDLDDIEIDENESVLELFRTEIGDGSDVDHIFTIKQLCEGQISPIDPFEFYVKDEDGVRWCLNFLRRVPIELTFTNENKPTATVDEPGSSDRPPHP